MDDVLQRVVSHPLVRKVWVDTFGCNDITPATLLSVLLSICIVLVFGLTFLPKARLAAWSVWYFLASGDKKLLKATDTAIDKANPDCRRVTIVFIRHGESKWNSVFNVGSKLLLPWRLLKALISELMVLFALDSIFFDSPLNSEGIKQACELKTFLASTPSGCLGQGSWARPVTELSQEDIISIIRSEVGRSKVVSSILKRAISTGAVCLNPRFLKTKDAQDKIHLMTALQEVSRNVDTLSLTPRGCLPQIPSGEASDKDVGDLIALHYNTRLDAKFNTGNKTLKQKALHRHEEFAKWAIDQKVDCIIVCGHSIWFREFFKSYLPKSSDHEAKTKKMVNCGCVAFDFYRSSSVDRRQSQVYRIDPEGVKVIYGGFETKGEKKKTL